MKFSVGAAIIAAVTISSRQVVRSEDSEPKRNLRSEDALFIPIPLDDTADFTDWDVFYSNVYRDSLAFGEDLGSEGASDVGGASTTDSSLLNNVRGASELMVNIKEFNLFKADVNIYDETGKGGYVQHVNVVGASATETDSLPSNDAPAAAELMDSPQLYNTHLVWAYTVNSKASKAMTDGNVAKAAKADAKSAKVGPKSSKADTVEPSQSPSESASPSVSLEPSVSAAPSISLNPSVSGAPSKSSAPSESFSPSSAPSQCSAKTIRPTVSLTPSVSLAPSKSTCIPSGTTCSTPGNCCQPVGSPLQVCRNTPNPYSSPANNFKCANCLPPAPLPPSGNVPVNVRCKVHEDCCSGCCIPGSPTTQPTTPNVTRNRCK